MGVVLLAGVVAALALAIAAVTATAAVPDGARITFFEAESVLREGGSQMKRPRVLSALVSVDGEGHDRRLLVRSAAVTVKGPTVSWNAEGSEFAFQGIPAKLVREEGESAQGVGQQRTYVARADGTGAHAIAGTTGAAHPVLSPDGRWLAFTRERRHPAHRDCRGPDSVAEALNNNPPCTSTWIVATAGGRPRRLTPWDSNRALVPSAFSPDGSALAVTVRRVGATPEVDTIDLASGARRRLAAEAAEAAYSADGSEIAFVSYRDHESVPGVDGPEATSEIYVAAADGSDARRLTHTPKLEETAPSWDPSGARLVYLRSPGGIFGLFERRVVESNADGTCPRPITTLEPRRHGGELVVGAPTWWAGPERGASPLSC